MTAGELIEMLRAVPPETPVLLAAPDQPMALDISLVRPVAHALSRGRGLWDQDHPDGMTPAIIIT